MSRAERAKGARGEREVAAIFREHGFDCARNTNQDGLRFKADLMGLDGVHVQVKRQETARPWAWIAQAEDGAQREPGERVEPHGLIPVVAFRRNSSPWYAIVPLDELARLLAETRA